VRRESIASIHLAFHQGAGVLEKAEFFPEKKRSGRCHRTNYFLKEAIKKIVFLKGVYEGRRGGEFPIKLGGFFDQFVIKERKLEL